MTRDRRPPVDVLSPAARRCDLHGHSRRCRAGEARRQDRGLNRGGRHHRAHHRSAAVGDDGDVSSSESRAHQEASHVQETRCASDQNPGCRSHDLVRGWDRGLGMAAQRVWVSRDRARHDAGWEAVTRRDGSGERIDHACVSDTGVPQSETTSRGLRPGTQVVRGALDHRWRARLRKQSRSTF
jgi:hypothetical protein